MKRVLMLVLILLLVPVFTGVYCCCASAAALPQEGLHKTPCHGCCAEIASAPDTPSDLNPHSFLFSSQKDSNGLKAPNPDTAQEIAVDRRANVPAGGGPFDTSQENPLYLSLRVLRI